VPNLLPGVANCPYFARVELLADRLALNLPDFKLHRIVKLPEEWEVKINTSVVSLLCNNAADVNE